MIGVGVMGYGYWGPNLARNFAEQPSAHVAAVCDADPARRAVATRRHPRATVCGDPAELLRSASVQAVALATPLATHFPLAMQCLSAGRHVLIEKPLAASSDEVRRLIDEAERRRLVLMAGHTFLYHPAIRKLHELAAEGGLGRLLYFDSVRINLGLIRNDAGVLWDLAAHDLAVMDRLLGAWPEAVSANGASHVLGRPASMAYLTCYFADGLLGHVHVNWLSPVKVRRTMLGGDQKMAVYDDLETGEKVKVYDRGVEALDASDPETARRLRINYREGDMYAPHLDVGEALAAEAAHFLDCVDTGAQPLSDGRSGLRVVRMLEAAEKSLAERGRPIALGLSA